jgi:hypothetical protein
LLVVQDVPAVQVPVVLHVCGWFEPEQLVCPGAQTPVQVPLTHVVLLLVHDVPTTQVPDALQVSTWFEPSQATEPATQVPTQAPPTQVEFVHALPEFCHAPPTQVCGC